MIEGTKVAPHVHIACIGSEAKSSRGFVRHVADLLRKRKIHSKFDTLKSKEHLVNYVNYCWRQADSFHQYGNKDFDFKKYILDD